MFPERRMETELSSTLPSWPLYIKDNSALSSGLKKSSRQHKQDGFRSEAKSEGSLRWRQFRARRRAVHAGPGFGPGWRWSLRRPRPGQHQARELHRYLFRPPCNFSFHFFEGNFPSFVGSSCNGLVDFGFFLFVFTLSSHHPRGSLFRTVTPCFDCLATLLLFWSWNWKAFYDFAVVLAIGGYIRRDVHFSYLFLGIPWSVVLDDLSCVSF